MAVISLQTSYLTTKPHTPHLFHSLTNNLTRYKPNKITCSKNNNNNRRKQRRDRAEVIRRNPIEKPAFLDTNKKVEGGDDTNSSKVGEDTTGANESAFLLTWLGFGAVILVEGIALSASGFLPEEWDKFLVKYLYPSFTPTVTLFFAGTIVYGVYKYLQNQNLTKEK